jgi:hypothetical protein
MQDLVLEAVHVHCALQWRRSTLSFTKFRKHEVVESNIGGFDDR